MHLVDCARNLEMLYETPREVPVHFPLDQGTVRKGLEPLSARGRSCPRRSPRKCWPPTGSPWSGRSQGYPVALKILSPDITHRTDVGGWRSGSTPTTRSARRTRR